MKKTIDLSIHSDNFITVMNKHTFKRGRGSNPASKNNLKLGAASRNWWVYERGAGIGWTPVFGPYFQKKAMEIASSLEATNQDKSNPIYTAATI